MATVVDVAANIAKVRAQMQEACEQAGRGADEVTLMLAAKYQPVENLIAAIRAGERVFGHNIIQQLEEAEEGLTDFQHFTTVIGHVQSNKLSTAMRYAQRIDTVDALRTAEQINRRQIARIESGESSDQPYPILLQVNSSGASTQFGCEPTDLLPLAEQILELSHVRIDGLMTIGANTDDESAIIRSFEVTRELSAKMRELPTLSEAKTISMGMTHDLELAIAHGSTEIRIGTAIFGPRPTK